MHCASPGGFLYLSAHSTLLHGGRRHHRGERVSITTVGWLSAADMMFNPILSEIFFNPRAVPYGRTHTCTILHFIALREEKHLYCYAETTGLKACIQVLAPKSEVCGNNFSMALESFQTPLLPVWFNIHSTVNS